MVDQLNAGFQIGGDGLENGLFSRFRGALHGGLLLNKGYSGYHPFQIRLFGINSSYPAARYHLCEPLTLIFFWPEDGLLVISEQVGGIPG